MGKSKRFIGAPLEETKAPEPKEEIFKGYVSGVRNYLNIRSAPKKEPNNQIAILRDGTELQVINPQTTYRNDDEDWYLVGIYNDGTIEEPITRGYAMKKFIKVVINYDD